MAAAPPPPAQVVTTTDVLDPRCPDDQVGGLAIDAEGTLYYTNPSAKCVYKSHRQRSRHGRGVVLAGDPIEQGTADGRAHSARFTRPRGVCLNPLEPLSLLVMDGQRVRAVDVVTGDVSALAIQGHTPERLMTCAWGGGNDVWMMDWADPRYKLLRMDMRSLVVEVVPTQAEFEQVLCVDRAGNAICRTFGGSQLWRVQPDGTTTLLAGTANDGYRDGPGQQAQLGDYLCAAAAGDGSIVVADCDSCRLRLVSPDGTVSTLAGSGEAGGKDGRLPEAGFWCLDAVVVSPCGDVLVLDAVWSVEDGGHQMLLRTVPARLQPPAHLAPAPAPPHPSTVLTASLLRSGLLADLTIRVVVGGREGGRRLQTGHQAAAAASSEGTGRCSDGSGGEAASPQAGPSSSSGASEVVDVPCHRAILATASPYFQALCVGPLAQQRAAARPVAPGSTAGRKRKAAGGAGGSGMAGTCAATVAATDPSQDTPTPMVVEVADASADAVHAVLRHVYTGDLGGVTAATAQDVLYLAQLWGLEGLLAACQAHVVEQLLGPGNAAEWLVCAHLRQYGVIRAAALRAVVNNYAAVSGDAAQAALLKQHPDLLMGALALVCGSQGAGV